MSTVDRVAVRNIELEYESHGTGGRPLLLVHGYTGSRDDFREQLPHLARDRRVIAIDQRGHGGSSNPGTLDAYAIEELVADLEAFAEALSLDSLDLLGHSLGGMVAMRFALRHPARLHSLILMNTAPFPPPMLPENVRVAGVAIAREHGMGKLAEVMRAGMERADGVPPAAAACIERMGDDAFFARIQRKLEQMDVEAFDALGRWLTHHESLEPRLPEIAQPTLVLTGDQDGAMKAGSESLASAIPQTVFEIIPEAAHSPQLENPEAWLACMQRHLARADAA